MQTRFPGDRRLTMIGSALLAVVLTALGVLPAHAITAVPTFAFMGDTTTVSSDMQEVLKVIFNEPLVNNVVTDTELMSCFETDTNVMEEQTTGGRYIESAHYFVLPAGTGARAEGEYIPEADPPVFKNSRVFLKKIQGTVEMTGDTMRRVRSSPGAYIDYMERALPDLVTRLVSDMDRMLIGFGAGVKARVSAISAYNVPAAGQFQVTIDRAQGIDGYEDAWLQFLEGERSVFTGSLAAPVALRNPGTTQSARIVDLEEDSLGGTLTYEGAEALRDAIVVNDYIGGGDNAGSSMPFGNPSTTREITGLLAAVDDGDIVATYMNIDRTAAGSRLWRGLMIDASATPFGGNMTEDLLTFADDEGATKGGGKADLIVMSRSAARGYWKSLKGDRFFLDPRAYFGGKEGLSIILGDRTVTLKVARKLPPQLAFGLQTNTFKRFSLNSWEWDDKTGSIWNRVTDATGRKDAFYATGLMYEELFCNAPRKNWRVNELERVS